MGTNYYLQPPSCPHCGAPTKQPIHLGKSSAGWCFGLHIRPLNGIEDLSDVFAMIRHHQQAGWLLQDEYGDDVPFAAFREVVTNRSWPFPTEHRTKEWLKENHAEPGPHGLVRHRIDGWHCIGHGKGTYDYIVGDFS